LPLDLSDFEVKDNELTEVQLVVFLRLLKHYWLRQHALPSDDKALAKIARLSSVKWRGNRDAVLRHFVETPEGWEPKLYADELQRAREIAEKRREAGRKGGVASARGREANDSSNWSSKAQADTDTGTDTSKNYPYKGGKALDARATGNESAVPKVVLGGAA
jgi:uncharacterized protein YdaU (DUF1376 family)